MEIGMIKQEQKKKEAEEEFHYENKNFRKLNSELKEEKKLFKIKVNPKKINIQKNKTKKMLAEMRRKDLKRAKKTVIDM